MTPNSKQNIRKAQNTEKQKTCFLIESVEKGDLCKSVFNKIMDIREHKKLSLEVLKKEIVEIYNIEKQICLNDFKKARKFRKKWEIIGHLLQ